MLPHLYELPAEYQEIEDLLIENGGELTEEIEARLAALNDALEVKTERICHLIRNVAGLRDAAKAEVDRLGKLVKTRDNTVDRLKAYLLRNLDDCKKRKVETGSFVVRIQRNPAPAISWLGAPHEIPMDFRKDWQPPDPSVDTEKVKRRLEELGLPALLKAEGVLAFSERVYDLQEEGALPKTLSVTYGSHVRIQ